MNEHEYGPCRDCGEKTDGRDTTNHFPYPFLCPWCQKKRERAYDDYVDPLHWYHGHDPDCIREG